MNINGSKQEFVFDKNGTPHFLTQNNFSFEQNPFQSQNLGAEWIVKDALGNQYFFGGSNSYNENTSSKERIRNGEISKSFTSSWCLKKIVLIQSHEIFNFNYFEGSPVTYKYYRKNKAICKKTTSTFHPAIAFIFVFKKAYTEYHTVNVINEEWDSGIDLTINNPKYLSVINSTTERVRFNYSSNRLDLQNAYELNDLIFETANNIRLKRLEFIKSYNVSSGLYPDKRLILDKIKLYNSNDSKNIDLLEFSYNQMKLPPRNSPLKDHWGYYSIYGDWFNDSNSQNFKNPDKSNTSACVLERISYPTGGGIKYYFENNSVLNV